MRDREGSGDQSGEVGCGSRADDGRCHVRSARAQGSHQLAATALSNAIAVVPDGDGVPAGAEVAVVMLQG